MSLVGLGPRRVVSCCACLITVSVGFGVLFFGRRCDFSSVFQREDGPVNPLCGHAQLYKASVHGVLKMVIQGCSLQVFL